MPAIYFNCGRLLCTILSVYKRFGAETIIRQPEFNPVLTRHQRTLRTELRAGHGDVELSNAGDDREGDLGLSVGLQSDPIIGGPGCLVGRHQPAATQLQTYLAAMDYLAENRGR